MKATYRWTQRCAVVIITGILGLDRGAALPAEAPAPTNQQVFEVRGTIKDLMPERRLVRIAHEKIPGYMEAMTMLFDVKDTNDLAGLQTNDRVSFRMVVTDTDGWIEDLKKIGRAEPTPAAPPLFRTARAVPTLKVGDALPDYQFTNELGRVFKLSDFKGQALGFTFIFTRCPFPTFCPRMTGNFTSAQSKLKNLPNAFTNWHLISVSFDPDYDTPAVLQRYARQFRADPAHWTFATGDLVEITALADHFEMVFWKDGTGFNHNARTVVVDARGRIHKIIEGNEWKVEEFVAAMVEAR